jgi:hypothetical protein
MTNDSTNDSTEMNENASQADPSPNGPQTVRGRDPRGRFAKGNGGGPGNPYASEVGKRRARLIKAIRGKDVDQAVRVMRDVMANGKDSDRLAAAKLLLDRALGPIVEADLVERLEQLEAMYYGPTAKA